MRTLSLVLLLLVAVVFTGPFKRALAMDPPRNLSHLVELEYGGFRLDPVTGRVVQRIRLRNKSKATVEGQITLLRGAFA